MSNLFSGIEAFAQSFSSLFHVLPGVWGAAITTALTIALIALVIRVLLGFISIFF